MSTPEVRRALLACDGASMPDDLRDLENYWTKIGTISTQNDDSDFPVVLAGLGTKVMGEVQARARDLIRIGACCFAADLRLPRDGVDVHRARWRREFSLFITVDEPEFWGRADVVASLEETLGFLTEDTWHLSFQDGPPRERELRIAFADNPSPRKPDTVVLFSGGSDSLCALVDVLRNDEREPVVVSHWPAGHIKGRQDALLEAVEHRLQHWHIPHASFEIHRAGKLYVESSQRTRGFLYACLGAAIAAQYGITEVRLADNGYVSINPPITDQLVGALASRGTHPKFLQLANRLLGNIFESGIHLTNPLWNKTRAEAMGVLKAAGCADLLNLTFTCGQQQGHERGKPLCGGCSQCVDRRIAVIAADLAEHDRLGRYELNLFADALESYEARTVAVAFVRFASELAGMHPESLWDRLPELDICADPDDPEYKKKVAGIPAMLIRHAQETMRVVELSERQAKEDGIFDQLPPTSLLRLWAAQRPIEPCEPNAAGFGVERVSYKSSFLRAGGTWIVEFRGDKGHYKNARGMTQLAHLLQHERKPLDIRALDDCRAVHAPRPLTRDQIRAELIRRREGMRTGYPDLGDALTELSEKFLREEVDAYRGRILDAQAKGDREHVRLLREEEAHGRKLLRAARNRRGELRRLGDPEEQARKNVSGNVQRCFALFALDLLDLKHHLKRFLHLGIPPVYDPDPPEGWTVRR